MSEILITRLKASIGKESEIFLHNGFRYFGKITNCDDTHLEILDYKSNSYKIIEIVNINDVNISIGKGERE